MHRKRHGAVFIGLALLILLPLAIVYGQPGEPTILTINYVEAVPNEIDRFNEIHAFFNLLDAQRLPIGDLTSADLNVFSNTEEITEFDLVPSEEPIAVILVLDTSGSMRGEPLDRAKAAANRFIEAKGEQDELAIFSFNLDVNDVSGGFISDPSQLRNSVNSLTIPEEGGWTCLYDAIFESAQLALERPQGLRAVVVMSDGVDTGPPDGSVPCSSHTLEEAIGKATDGLIRVPIYTIGLGSGINEDELSAIARRTGGQTLIAPNPEDLNDAFQAVSNLLKSQYVITFRLEQSGNFSLRIRLAGDASVAGEQTFFVAELPPPPVPSVDISPSGPTFDGNDFTIVFSANVSMGESGVPLTNVSWFLDGELRVSFTEVPYDTWTLDLTDRCLSPGEHTLRIMATNAAGGTLEKSGTFMVTEAMCPPTPTPIPIPEPPPRDPAINPLIIILIAVAVIAALVVSLLVLRRSSQVEEKVAQVLVPHDEDEKTVDAFIDPIGLVARLRQIGGEYPLVDDKTSVDMTTERFRMGRSKDNDLALTDPKASRVHAEIYYNLDDGTFFLQDLNSNNGTFINEQFLKGNREPLTHNAIIKIGTTRLVFSIEASYQDKTEDEMYDYEEDERTVEDTDIDRTEDLDTEEG